MAFNITPTARALKDQIQVKPQIVLCIDGIDLKFGTADVLIRPLFDEDYLFDDGLFFDTPIKDPTSRSYISVDGQTSSRVFNQLFPDKGGAGSVQSFRVTLLNKDRELTPYFTSGNLISDLLGSDAQIYIGFVGGEFRKDFILAFDGFIDNVETAHNTFTINVANPTQRARQNLFNIISALTTSTITDVDTSIPVDSTTGFIIPTVDQEEYIKSYIQINDEIIKLSQTNTGTTFDNVLRNQLKTIADSHDIGDECTSFIRLLGNPLQLALRLLMSQPKEEYYVDGEAVDRFVKLNDSTNIENTIFFNSDVTVYNITEGDLISVENATDPANNFTDRLVTEVGFTTNGTFITVDGDGLVLEVATSATIKIKSRFATLPVGAGLKPKYIDLQGIAELDTLLGASLPDIDIYVKDEIELKTFLEKEIYKPVGLFALTRKGRYSIYAALPPLNTNETVFLNQTNIINLPTLKIVRSTENNHYNTVVYKFEQQALEDDFKAGLIIVSQNSVNRIPVGNKQLTIEAAGLRDTSPVRIAIERQAQRIIDKYQFAPQYILGVQVSFKYYTLEVGDSVVFGGEGVLMPDTEAGTDYFPETIMEISNKVIDTRKGVVTLDLINSAFGVKSRYGVVSASSYVESGGINFLVLKRSFATTALQLETEKWQDMIGRKVVLRDVNFTKSQELTIASIATDLENKLIFEENITIAIAEDDILELGDYDTKDNFQKSSYVFLNPQVEITAVTDASTIEADPTNLFEGATILVHDDTYSNVSQEVIISQIAGSVLILSEPLSYLPSIGDKLDLIGFKSDSGDPYRTI